MYKIKSPLVLLHTSRLQYNFTLNYLYSHWESNPDWKFSLLLYVTIANIFLLLCKIFNRYLLNIVVVWNTLLPILKFLQDINIISCSLTLLRHYIYKFQLRHLLYVLYTFMKGVLQCNLFYPFNLARYYPYTLLVSDSILLVCNFRYAN